MNKIIFIILLVCCNKAFSQQMDKSILLDSFSKFYFIPENYIGVYDCLQKFKSSIAEDTSISNARVYIKNENKKIHFRIDFLKQDIIERSVIGFYGSNKIYEFIHSNKVYVMYKFSQIDGYQMLLNSFPGNSKELTETLQKSIYSGYKKGNHNFLLPGKTISIDSSFKHVKNVIKLFTALGIEYKEDNFNFQLIEKASNIFDSEYYLTSYKKFIFSDNKQLSKKDIGKKVNDSLLILLKSVLPKESEKKYYLIDLFYQSCLPCVKSIPFLNTLAKDSLLKNLQVIGIDPVERDTLNMDKFIKRYKIVYPIIKGNTAIAIWNYIKNSSYPTTLLISNTGELLRFHNGLSENEFDKIKKDVK